MVEKQKRKKKKYALVDLRKELGLSIYDVAAMIGATPMSFSQYENGQHEPDIYMALFLCKLYNKRIDQIDWGKKGVSMAESKEIKNLSIGQLEQMFLNGKIYDELTEEEKAEMKKESKSLEKSFEKETETINEEVYEKKSKKADK